MRVPRSRSTMAAQVRGVVGCTSQSPTQCYVKPHELQAAFPYLGPVMTVRISCAVVSANGSSGVSSLPILYKCLSCLWADLDRICERMRNWLPFQCFYFIASHFREILPFPCCSPEYSFPPFLLRLLWFTLCCGSILWGWQATDHTLLPPC